MQAVSRARPVFEFGLDLCVFLFLPILVLFSRGAAPLVAVAGLCAFGLAAPDELAAWRRVRAPALLFGALLLWGLCSAIWAIHPNCGLLTIASISLSLRRKTVCNRLGSFERSQSQLLSRTDRPKSVRA